MRRASRASKGVTPEDLTVEIDRQGRVLRLHEEGRRARERSDILAEALPGLILGHLLPEDHVLDREGRSAVHPADPLDRRAAGRRIVPFELAGVRSGALTQRASAAGRARDRRHHRGLRTALCAITA